jgi:hypothetical protein
MERTVNISTTTVATMKVKVSRFIRIQKDGGISFGDFQ